MAYQRPTLLDIITRIQSDITTRLASPSTLLRRSILKVVAVALGGVIHLLYGKIDYDSKNLFITSCDAESIDIYGNEYGLRRTAATKATGPVLVTGTDAVVILASSQLESKTGTIYLTDAIYTPAGGQITVTLVAQDAGIAGNEDIGAILSFISPIPGIDTSATVLSPGIEGGADEELLEDYRTRVLTRKRQPPHGGADFDYVAWMLEVSGVTRAWAIKHYQGVGTIGGCFVRDNDANIFPSSAEIATVEAYIISHTDPLTGKTIGIPTTAEAGLYMISPIPLSVNATVEIYPNTSEIQVLVNDIISQLIKLKGGPEQAIYISDMSGAIVTVKGYKRHRITLPTGLDYITASANEIHVPGTLTFSTYNG